jgi:hypothetical protein
MVKYWRENSVNIVLYLDDGFGMNTDEEQCIKDSFQNIAQKFSNTQTLPSLF